MMQHQLLVSDERDRAISRPCSVVHQPRPWGSPLFVVRLSRVLLFYHPVPCPCPCSPFHPAGAARPCYMSRPCPVAPVSQYPYSLLHSADLAPTLCHHLARSLLVSRYPHYPVSSIYPCFILPRIRTRCNSPQPTISTFLVFLYPILLEIPLPK